MREEKKNSNEHRKEKSEKPRKPFENEAWVLHAFEENKRNFPDWFKGIRLSTKEEDHRLVDIVAETDCGDFYIQTKHPARKKSKRPSKGLAQFYKRLEELTETDPDKRFFYIGFVVSRSSLFEDIRTFILDELQKKRAILLTTPHLLSKTDRMADI